MFIAPAHWFRAWYILVWLLLLRPRNDPFDRFAGRSPSWTEFRLLMACHIPPGLAMAICAFVSLCAVLSAY